MGDARRPLLPLADDSSADLENPPVCEEEKKPQGKLSYGTLEKVKSDLPYVLSADIYREVHELQEKLNKDPFSLSKDQRDESGAKERAQNWRSGAVCGLAGINVLLLLIGGTGLMTEDHNKSIWNGMLLVGGLLLLVNCLLMATKPCLRQSENLFRKNVVPKLDHRDRRVASFILSTIEWDSRFSERGDILKSGINFFADKIKLYENELKTALPRALPSIEAKGFFSTVRHDPKGDVATLGPGGNLILEYLDVPTDAVASVVVSRVLRKR